MTSIKDDVDKGHPLFFCHRVLGHMATPIVLARAPGNPTSEAVRVCAELGIIPSAWHDAQREGGAASKVSPSAAAPRS